MMTRYDVAIISSDANIAMFLYIFSGGGRPLGVVGEGLSVDLTAKVT